MLFFWSTFKHFSNLINFWVVETIPEQPLASLGSLSFSLSPLELAAQGGRDWKTKKKTVLGLFFCFFFLIFFLQPQFQTPEYRNKRLGSDVVLEWVNTWIQVWWINISQPDLGRFDIPTLRWTPGVFFVLFCFVFAVFNISSLKVLYLENTSKNRYKFELKWLHAQSFYFHSLGRLLHCSLLSFP